MSILEITIRAIILVLDSFHFHFFALSLFLCCFLCIIPLLPFMYSESITILNFNIPTIYKHDK